MKKKEIGVISAIILGFIIFIAIGTTVQNNNASKQAEKQRAEQLQAEADRVERERLAEEAKKAEEEKLAEEARKAEEARIEEEKRVEAERIEQEKEAQRKEAERIEAERVAEEKRQQEIAANNNFYVEDGKANHDTSTGYDSPDSDPNEPTITSSTGYVASGNNYMHKTTDCKFIRGKATSTVDANSWSGAVCNCWYY